ncbi:MAG: AMP-binding protein [Desulfobacteraceae bacterium]
MNELQLAKVEVDVNERSDGSIIIQNKAPLSDGPANLCAWLHQHAAAMPDKPFVLERSPSGEWEGLTYADALSRVNRISNGLLALERDPSRPVAVLSENSINMALFQLAAMQIGLAVTPISYAYSARSKTGGHIKHILDVTQPTVLAMSDADLHMPKLNQWDNKDLALYAFSNSDHHTSVQPFSALFAEKETLTPMAQARFDQVTDDTLAKIQFTSGSTNLPKGVMVTHGMQVSNQLGIGQMWPFVDANDKIVDWLPWNHTFGGNFVFNMALMHGATFYIDNGNPSPAGIDITIRNIKAVKPSIYFGVPASYIALLARMEADPELKAAFFHNLKFIFTAAAALDQATYQGMRQLSIEARGKAVPFFSAWGCTETSPDATLVYWEIDDARVIGLPIPGVKVKLAPDSSGKREMRVKGPNVTQGYFANQEATQAAFDAQGYYLTQDGGKFLDADKPEQGLIFDGRTSEDFKLVTGVWVNNAKLRSSIHTVGQPFLLEVVPAEINRAYLTCLIYPNIQAIRNTLAEASEASSDDDAFLKSTPVVELFRSILKKHNEVSSGSSWRIERLIILNEQPRIDKNETTDKGYLNQSAVLAHHKELVADLYADPPPPHVIVVDDG